ncbi:hypothetical protein B0H14DRAFT_2998725, partial [Mycena olivaceomarginata]
MYVPTQRLRDMGSLLSIFGASTVCSHACHPLTVTDFKITTTSAIFAHNRRAHPFPSVPPSIPSHHCLLHMCYTTALSYSRRRLPASSSAVFTSSTCVACSPFPSIGRSERCGRVWRCTAAQPSLPCTPSRHPSRSRNAHSGGPRCSAPALSAFHPGFDVLPDFCLRSAPAHTSRRDSSTSHVCRVWSLMLRTLASSCCGLWVLCRRRALHH